MNRRDKLETWVSDGFTFDIYVQLFGKDIPKYHPIAHASTDQLIMVAEKL